MNFKVKCVRWHNPNPPAFIEGKIYDVKDNIIEGENGDCFTAWSFDSNADFNALKLWFSDFCDFELVEEKKVFTKSDLQNGDVVLKSGYRIVLEDVSGKLCKFLCREGCGGGVAGRKADDRGIGEGLEDLTNCGGLECCELI